MKVLSSENAEYRLLDDSRYTLLMFPIRKDGKHIVTEGRNRWLDVPGLAFRFI